MNCNSLNEVVEDINASNSNDNSELTSNKKSKFLASLIKDNRIYPCTSSTISKTTKCCICLDEFNIDEKVVALTCNDKHILHFACFKQWEESCPIIKCPYCRKRIKTTEI